MWSIKEANKEDVQKIEDFLLSIEEFKDTCLPNIESEVWKWQYIRGEEGVKNVLIAENEMKRIIAHYALLQTDYQVKEYDVKAGFICKLAVDKEYRRQFIFFNISLELLNGYKKTGIAFVYGLINKKEHLKAHSACGFKTIDDIPIYAKPYYLTSIVKKMKIACKALYPFIKPVEVIYLFLMNKSRINKRFTIERIKRFDDNINALIKYIANAHKIYAKRDAQILNWRFIDAPHYRGYRAYVLREERNIIGYFILRTMEMKGYKVLAIVDFCFDFNRGDVASCIMKFIDRTAIKDKVDLSLSLINSKSIARHFKKGFYFRTPESFSLIVHESDAKLDLKDSSINDWFITWLDHDYV